MENINNNQILEDIEQNNKISGKYKVIIEKDGKHVEYYFNKIPDICASLHISISTFYLILSGNFRGIKKEQQFLKKIKIEKVNKVDKEDIQKRKEEKAKKQQPIFTREELIEKLKNGADAYCIDNVFVEKKKINNIEAKIEELTIKSNDELKQKNNSKEEV